MANEPVFPLLSCSRLRMGIDGTGVTTLIAGAGCPLKCRWCINEQLLREAPVTHVTAEQLYDKVKIDDLYFQATGGGVTFGGGESLLHASFISRFKNLIPETWKVNAETSLAVSSELINTVIGSVDLFIVDCKDMDDEIYHRYTGGDAELMKSNLRLLLDAVGPEQIIVRVPLIPEYNTEADQQRNVQLLHQMGVTRLELFDYVRKNYSSASRSPKQVLCCL